MDVVDELLLVLVETPQVVVEAMELAGHLLVDVVLLANVLDLVAHRFEVLLELLVLPLVVGNLRRVPGQLHPAGESAPLHHVLDHQHCTQF